MPDAPALRPVFGARNAHTVERLRLHKEAQWHAELSAQRGARYASQSGWMFRKHRSERREIHELRICSIFPQIA